MSINRKKRFSVSQTLQNSLSETINVVKNNAGQVRFQILPLTWIETDPGNPRELKLSIDDIKEGIAKADPAYGQKSQELEAIQSMANTIKTKGLINPVVVYKYGEKYRLVAGERRFLSSLLAGKEDIQARILNERPKNLELRQLQWIENTEREDLSLKDRIGNVKAIVEEYLKEYPGTEITATLIKELIGISLPQATCYLAVLNPADELKEQITTGKINNLDKAALIAKIKNQELRHQAIQSCLQGNTIKQLRALIESEESALKTKNSNKKIQKRGRALTKIHLGTTNKPEVVKKIVSSVLKQSEYKHLDADFAAIDWQHYEHATLAFKKLVSILEKEGIS